MRSEANPDMKVRRESEVEAGADFGNRVFPIDGKSHLYIDHYIDNPLMLNWMVCLFAIFVSNIQSAQKVKHGNCSCYFRQREL